MTPDKEQVVEPLSARFAAAFIHIRGTHNPRFDEEFGEVLRPCAWCRLAGEQAAEALATLDAARTASVAGLDRERLADLRQTIRDGVEAFRLTREYVGEDTLPAIEGWSWFDWTQKALAAFNSAPSIEQEPGAWNQRAALMAADRALAVPHREDDKPCGCDECMAYGAEDEGGGDWYRVPTPNRIVIRALDSGDDRLAPLVKAFDDHAAALRDDREGPQ